MPRCCVPGCDTGTSAEIVRTRRAKARNKSTFLLPANYGLFRKWEKVLGLKYDSEEGRSGRVCELHFDEADIIRHFYKQMEDGTIKQFTFSRPTLVKGVIPLSTPREEDFKPQNPIRKKYNKQKKVSAVQNNKDHVSKRGRKRKSSLVDDDCKPNKKIRKNRSRSRSLEEDKCIPNMKSRKRRSRSSSLEGDDEYKPNKRPKKSNVKKYAKAPKNYEKRKYKRQIKTPRNKLISSSIKKSLPIYTFDKLVHNLNRRNSKLPKGWEFSIVDDDTVKLVYTPESSKYFMTCTLKRDTLIEIRAFNTKVMMNLEFKFLSHTHLLENLEELQKGQFCKGIVYNRFTKRCKGFLPFNEEQQGLKNFGRCKVCKKVWDNIIRRPRQTRITRNRVKQLKRLRSGKPKVKLSTKILKFIKKKIKAGKKF